MSSDRWAPDAGFRPEGDASIRANLRFLREGKGPLRRPAMLNPFKLFGRLFLAFFKITGYTIAYGSQILWCLIHRKPDRIGDALGEYGHAVTDAIAGIFKD